MHLKPLALAAALASAILTQSALAAAAPDFQPRQRVIVQLQAKLPAVPVDLNDTRMTPGHRFQGVRTDVVGHVQRMERAHGFTADQGFSTAVNGFSASLTSTQIAALRKDAAVRVVEPDAVMKAVAQTVPYGIANSGATVSSAAKAGDGLANATLRLDNVRAFVVDTGIANHPDLNVVDYQNFVGDGVNGDCNGHGTHVAGTIGAKDDASYVVGMAPGVSLGALKVLDCNGSGYASNLIKAFDYAASQAMANPTMRYVANASIGFPTGTVLTTLDSAIQNAVAAGVFVAVAAGNSADNTCSTTMVQLSSGTNGTGVMAVAAADSTYREATFSSYGACVATWAPGVSVTSTSNTGSVATMSGTSMATPHVTGAAAVVRAVNSGYAPAQVDTALKTLAKSTGTASKDGRAIRHLDISQVSDSTSYSTASTTTPLLNFGTVKLNSAAPSQQAKFVNDGTSTMTLTGLSGLPTQLTVTGSTCSNVAPGATCAVTLQLKTSKRGSFNTTVKTLGATTNTSFVVQGAVK